MWYLSYWIVPIFSSLVWLAMLIAMLVVWSTEGMPHYPSMDASQHIPYISDIGAEGLKPLFIAMSVVTVVSFDLAFILERYLRHAGKLARNTSAWQKLYSFCAIVASIAGAAGLILLSIFDTLHHPKMHQIFLAIFIVGYIVSAIFICWEYQRLGVHFRNQSVLRYSFWIKLFFIIIEIALAVAYGVTTRQNKLNISAVLEWVVAFIYFFYVLSFFIDFMPAVHTRHYQSSETEMDAAERGGVHKKHHSGVSNGHVQASNGYTNGYTNGATNGTHAYAPAGPAPLPSRNF